METPWSKLAPQDGSAACCIAFLAAFLLLLLPLPGQSAPLDSLPDARRIVILGDSITYQGDYVTDVESWMLSRGFKAEVINLGLPSETAADLTPDEQMKTHIKPFGYPRPAIGDRLASVLEKTQPDWVFACYGMNDALSLPATNAGFARYRTAMEKLRDAVLKAGAKRFIVLTPPIHDAGAGKISPQDKMLARFSEWLLGKRKDGWEVVDLHGPMRAALDEKRETDPKFKFAGDGVHPNREGHDLMARQIVSFLASPAEAEAFFARSMFLAPKIREVLQQQMLVRRDAWLSFAGYKRPGLPAGLPMDAANAKIQELTQQLPTLEIPPFAGTKTKWNGFDRFNFPTGDGKICSVIAPATPLPGRLWAWKGEFLDAFPATEIELLKRGVYIVFLNAPNLLGSPDAVRFWNTCYAELTTKYQMAPRPALIGLSRGGLYCYNWAIANPDKVAGIYGDAPVVDLKSWPGGKGKGIGSPADWKLAFQDYNFKDEAEALAFTGNPLDNLKPLADAKIPLLHVYGDADNIVPPDENTLLLAPRYRALGGSIDLIAKPGIGHHPHGLPDPKPIVAFILRAFGSAGELMPDAAIN